MSNVIQLGRPLPGVIRFPMERAPAATEPQPQAGVLLRFPLQRRLTFLSARARRLYLLRTA